MKIMVTGATGQLGHDVVALLRSREIPCWGVSTADFDLTDAQAVLQAVQQYRPDAIIHCAAYTAVDRAESSPNDCCAVNSGGTLYLTRAAAKVGAKLMYVSTDYVFSGEGSAPHETDEPARPLNVYGLSKAQGEEAVRGLLTKYFIVRTSWVYGLHGSNFVRTMIRLGREKQHIAVVDDQVGAPTYTRDLAQTLVRLVQTERYGVYHATGEGCCSFAEFAQTIMRLTGSRCHVQPIPSAEYPSAARRPLNSRLSKRSLDEAGLPRLPIWEDALQRYLEELRSHGEL